MSVVNGRESAIVDLVWTFTQVKNIFVWRCSKHIDSNCCIYAQYIQVVYVMVYIWYVWCSFVHWTFMQLVALTVVYQWLVCIYVVSRRGSHGSLHVALTYQGKCISVSKDDDWEYSI